MAVPRFFTNQRETSRTDNTSPARESTAAMTTWMPYNMGRDDTWE